MNPKPLLLAALAALVALALTSAPAHAAAEEPWSALHSVAAADVRAGKPLVTVVVVPLCSNAQIDCGGAAAGRPGALATNLYWGAIFGARRFFERPRSGWERVELRDPRPGELALERAVYRRRAPGVAWGREGEIEQLVVLEAVHGDAIDAAVDRFWSVATFGGRVRFVDGERERDERVHVAGYAGHNRLMDGKELPAAREAASPAAIPAFVFACHSQSYFDAPLRAAGSTPLVTTRALMAPEGYVIEAMARALGENLPPAAARARVVGAYASWQRLAPGVASSMFAPAPGRAPGPAPSAM